MRFFTTLSVLFISCGPENEINEIVKQDDTYPQLVVEPLLLILGRSARSGSNRNCEFSK